MYTWQFTGPRNFLLSVFCEVLNIFYRTNSLFTSHCLIRTVIFCIDWRHEEIFYLQQFKRRYFVVKQQSDLTYNLEFFKDERRTEVKGVIYLDCAQDIVKVNMKLVSKQALDS